MTSLGGASLDQLTGSTSRNVSRLLIRNIVLGRPPLKNQEHLVAKKAKKAALMQEIRKLEKPIREKKPSRVKSYKIQRSC
jgi:hypothetical protein